MAASQSLVPDGSPLRGEQVLSAVPLMALTKAVGGDRVRRLELSMAALRERLDNHVVWHVNSTEARGGGIAEMLATILPYARGAGVATRWLVMDGTSEFFNITKRLHNILHGSEGDGGPLNGHEEAVFTEVCRRNSVELASQVSPGDVVILHDPQTAGMTVPLAAAGARVVWRCHIGHDHHNQVTERGWRFLRPWLHAAHATVFSRESYVPAGLIDARVIAPALDPCSTKNRELSSESALAVLYAVGLVATPPAHCGDSLTTSTLRRAIVIGSPPPSDVPLIVQVSRWDRLKDMRGVLEGFVRYVAPQSTAYLLLAGPSTEGVNDDPEGMCVLQEVTGYWAALSLELRKRVALAELPIENVTENALVVNALQRHATIVVQKSLAEGFGLTCTEAMWKQRPVVVSRVGGLADQVVDGDSGIMLDDPYDLEKFGHAVITLLNDPVGAARLGWRAKERVREKFLVDSSFAQWAQLLSGICSQ